MTNKHWKWCTDCKHLSKEGFCEAIEVSSESQSYCKAYIKN